MTAVAVGVLMTGVLAGIVGAIVAPFGFVFVALAAGCALAVGVIVEREARR